MLEERKNKHMKQTHKSRRLLFSCLLISLWITSWGLTQTTQTLTLEQCVSMALEQNPEVKIARKQLAKSNADIWTAYGTLLPSIEASASLQHAWNIQENTIPNFLKPMLAPLAPMIPELALMPDFVTMSFGMENTLTYGARLTQPLFLGGAGIAGVQIAYAARNATQQQLDATEQSILYKTANAFYQTLLARELVQVQEDALKQAETNLDIVNKKYDVGSASGLDKMRAEVDVANLKPAVFAAKSNYQAALTGLRTIVGLPPNTEIGVEGDLAFVPDEFAKLTLEELQQQAASQRPELSAVMEQKKLASKSLTVARSQFLPKVLFMTDYSYLGMRNKNLNFKQDEMSKGFTSSISVQLPLFSGFKNTKGYQKAELDLHIAKDTQKQVQDGIAAEVEIVYNKFQEARQKYLAAQETIAMAQEAMRLANLMYEEGASTQLEVLSAQLALTQARMNHISALYEYQMARYGLRKAAGILIQTL